MGEIEGFWIRNYKSMKQVGIGTCYPQFVYVDDDFSVLPFQLDAITLFAGACGSGKSTIIDVFSFISDCFHQGVDYACLKRGGYDVLYSQGGKGPMSFGFHYREEGEAEAVTYALSILHAKNKVPFIESELLAYRRGKEAVPIFFLQNGTKSIRYLAPDPQIETEQLTKIEFTDYKHLGLAALESHPKYPVLASVRNMFQNWVLSNFTPDSARGLDLSLPRRHDSPRGVSLSGLVRYMVDRYGANLDSFLKKVAAALPRVEAIKADRSRKEKPVLSFKMEGLPDEVPITQLSDATIRLFAYFLLLGENIPAPMIAIEEPENGLDRLHCWALVQQLVRFDENPHDSQLFLTTHHPGIADSLHPGQVWLLEKDPEGFTTIERTADAVRMQEIIEGNRELDPRWFSDRFEEKL